MDKLCVFAVFPYSSLMRRASFKGVTRDQVLDAIGFNAGTRKILPLLLRVTIWQRKQSSNSAVYTEEEFKYGKEVGIHSHIPGTLSAHRSTLYREKSELNEAGRAVDLPLREEMGDLGALFSVASLNR
ncbi:unnamed protein product [Periconia digitata]|uniref:Uncharacterized protein n=1 Tax=Periconia digitata TaxID=1303443 RepID=A0A9W4XTP7_9PLEO|nr:unnamed protein product [Periconia digitata]